MKLLFIDRVFLMQRIIEYKIVVCHLLIIVRPERDVLLLAN